MGYQLVCFLIILLWQSCWRTLVYLTTKFARWHDNRSWT